MKPTVNGVDAVFDKGPCAAETKIWMVSIDRVDRRFDGNWIALIVLHFRVKATGSQLAAKSLSHHLHSI